MRASATVAIDAEPGELAAVKASARRAYDAAKRRGAAPAALCDRWMSDTLLACDGAPEGVQAVMMHRTEVLFALLVDRQRWLNPETAPNA